MEPAHSKWPLCVESQLLTGFPSQSQAEEFRCASSAAQHELTRPDLNARDEYAAPQAL